MPLFVCLFVLSPRHESFPPACHGANSPGFVRQSPQQNRLNQSTEFETRQGQLGWLQRSAWLETSRSPRAAPLPLSLLHSSLEEHPGESKEPSCRDAEPYASTGPKTLLLGADAAPLLLCSSCLNSLRVLCVHLQSVFLVVSHFPLCDLFVCHLPTDDVGGRVKKKCMETPPLHFVVY